MKILDDVKLDFNDVLILPKRSEYSSRSEVSLERTFRFKYSPYTWTGVPIMVSNMDTTGTIEMALELQKHKVLTCLHKYYKVVDLIDKDLDLDYIAVSTGIGDTDLENLDEIMREINPKFICIDVANGYMTKFIERCREIRDKYPSKILIAGNVCTQQGVLELVVEGKVDIVKVGIVVECADTAHGLDAHIISDGGLQVVGDFAKAYGAGADFVMSGSMFAGNTESGGELIEESGKKYKVFYGMSSSTAMNKYSGGIAHYRSSEGKTVKIEYRGDVRNTILDIQGGIRSTMTYIGAKKIKDIPKCTTFIRVNRQLNQIYDGKEI
jgi:GMP reductase